jgi:heptosyltransferase-3
MQTNLSGHRILIAKTTHLGDLVISLPLAACLKKQFPGSTVMFLTQPRTAAVAERCLDVDAVYTEPDSFEGLVTLLTNLQLDVFIQVNTSKHLAEAAKAANIPMRIGSLFRVYNWWLCTHLAFISREYKHLNKRLLDLEYLKPLGIATPDFDELPSLYRFSWHDPQPLIERLNLNMGKRRIILHPCLITAKSHQWPLAAYHQLMASFDPQQIQWIITGTAADRAYLEPLLAINDPNIDYADTVGQLALNELITLIMVCDGLVASNTGPLHLAAALGIKTLGFYQSKPAVFKRWAAAGNSVTMVHSKLPCQGDKSGKDCPCVQAIDTKQVQAVINGWFL